MSVGTPRIAARAPTGRAALSQRASRKKGVWPSRRYSSALACAMALRLAFRRSSSMRSLREASLIEFRARCARRSEPSTWGERAPLPPKPPTAEAQMGETRVRALVLAAAVAALAACRSQPHVRPDAFDDGQRIAILSLQAQPRITSWSSEGAAGPELDAAPVLAEVRPVIIEGMSKNPHFALEIGRASCRERV